KRNLTTHKRIVHTAGPVSFPCSGCESSFKSKFQMDRHFERMHAPIDTRPHVCEGCNKRYVTRRELVQHSKIHSDEYRYGCDKCDMVFQKWKEAQTHKRKVHSKSRGAKNKSETRRQKRVNLSPASKREIKSFKCD